MPFAGGSEPVKDSNKSEDIFAGTYALAMSGAIQLDGFAFESNWRSDLFHRFTVNYFLIRCS